MALLRLETGIQSWVRIKKYLLFEQIRVDGSIKCPTFKKKKKKQNENKQNYAQSHRMNNTMVKSNQTSRKRKVFNCQWKI